ncbi:MAG: EFR1 family ferrodoxin [Bacteroidaceae bacterium]|nr:EFR1 family ferrodoxin [Bacteroidaceae bacterium]
MIVYFSGTGNSLSVARQLAELTIDKLMHLNMASATDLSEEKRIGLVFPTYSYDAPLLVKKLLRQINIGSNAYIYVIVTCGSDTGNAINTAIRILGERNLKVAYSRKVCGPDSSAIAFGNNANAQFGRYACIPEQLEEIANDIMAECCDLEYQHKTMTGRLVNNTIVFPIASWLMKQEVNADKCVGCGICAKVCPCQNIVIEDRKARIAGHDHCTQCLACVHFCPQQAIEIRGRNTLKEQQFHHPSVKAKDMFGVGMKSEKLL